MHSTQLSLFAAVKKKQSNVPVFLIYAGIIHAIGLALLLPLMITLPGPGSETGPEVSVIDIEVVPATSPAAIIGHGDEQTAALPSIEMSTAEGAAVGDDGEAGAAADVAPESRAEPKAKESAKADAERPAKVAPKPASKTAARSRTARPSARRSAASVKIAPFNGALSGLFTPGAPTNRRR